MLEVFEVKWMLACVNVFGAQLEPSSRMDDNSVQRRNQTMNRYNT